MNKKSVKLYNVIFPIWLLWMLPMTWIVVLPANFVIDLLVVVLTMKYLKIPSIKQNAKAVILRVWLMGFAADFIGTLAMFVSVLIDFDNQTVWGNWWYSHITNAVSFNPFDNIFAFVWVTVCVLLTAFFIYFFNYKWCLKKADLNDAQKKKIALSLAVFTAPYLFYLPTKWFLHFN